MGGLYSRLKTWVSTEDVTYSDLNAEFDNFLTNFIPAMMDDHSTNVAQMQSTADPGEVGTESLATTLAGELQRLRFIIKEITGKTHWYETPSTSLTGLANAVGTGLESNRLVSGRVRGSGSNQPTFLVPHGAAATVTCKGATTNFIYYVNGTEYTISTDVTLTNLTTAPSTNNTCTINDANAAADPFYTKYTGEDGAVITVDAMGTELTALVGKFAAFKLAGAATEYFIAFVESPTRLSKAYRGYFFDSSDAPIVRSAYTDNDVITLMKLTWVFAKSDGTLTATYNNPVWSKDQPSSPSIGDYWFDLANNKWKVYGVGSYTDANATLIGICIQDGTNSVAARSFEFFTAYEATNTYELLYASATQVKSKHPGALANVWGETIKGDHNIRTWDITLDRDTGVSETASTYYYFYLTDSGDQIISDIKPFDRRSDLLGYYHPHNSWRCLGRAFNNSSSDLTEVDSYFRGIDASLIRAVSATDVIYPFDKIMTLTGASYTIYLPPAALHRGNTFTFIHQGTSLSQVYTLDGEGSETINGTTTVALYTNGELLEIISDGSNWHIARHYANTAPASYTPTTAGFGSVSGMAAYWRRSGASMILEIYYGTGTVTGDGATITLPTGASLHTTLYNTLRVVGYAHNGAGSVNSTSAVQANSSVSATVLHFSPWIIGSATNPFTSGLGNQCAGNSQAFGLRAEVVISGWLP